VKKCYAPGVKLPASLLGIALLGAACSSNAIVQQGPSDTLRAYARALDDGRVDDAYRLLSDEAKRNMSLEAFRRAAKENPDEVHEIARAISRPASDPLVTASVVMPDGGELLLVFENGKWHIDAAAIDLYSQATPRQALTGFLRAFERKRYDVILRYVPDAEKEGLGTSDEGAGAEAAAPDAAGKAPGASAPAQAKVPREMDLTAEKIRASWEGPQKDQINRIVQAIRAALPSATIEETGDSAAMAYGAGGTVALIREHGAWKILEL
jgi:hypothetical protein